MNGRIVTIVLSVSAAAFALGIRLVVRGTL